MSSIKGRRGFVNNIVSLFVAGLLVSCGGTSETELINRAKEYIAKQELNAASLELKNVLMKNEKNSEARYLLGKVNLQMGDVSSAEKEFRRALDAGWDESAVQLLLAEILFRQGEFQKVLDETRVKDTYPDAVRANLMGFWAASEVSLGRWDAAEQAIATGSAIDDNALWLLYSRIRLHVYRDELQAARELTEHAIELHPESMDIWLLSAALADEKGDYQKAMSDLNKVIELDPPGHITPWERRARISQGQLWLKQKEYEKALGAVTPILTTYPSDPIANYLVALANFKQGEFDKTEEHLLKVLNVAPAHRPSLQLFGALNYARSDFQQAAYYLEKVTSDKPEDVNAQTLLGRTYFMLGQFDDAEKRLKYASTMVDDAAELQAMVGLTILKSGDVQGGIQELEKASTAAPGDTAIRSELARAYMTAGKPELAVKELESVLEGSERQHRSHALLLLAYLQAGDTEKASAIADRLIIEVPDNPLPHYFSGVVNESKKDYASANESYQKALSIDPENSMAQLGLARLHMRAGSLDKARALYENVLKTDQDNSQALYELAKILGQEGNTEEAVKLVKQARAKNSNALEPRLFLAEYYIQKKDYSKSLMVSKEAAVIAPYDSRVLALLGRSQLRNNQVQEASSTLRALVKQEPDWSDGYFYLSQVQVFNKDLQAARKSLKKALELDPAYIKARLALGNLDLKTGNIEGALENARYMQKSKGSESAGYMLEGDILMSTKKPAKAVEAYQSAFDHTANSVSVVRLYSALKAAGKTEDAVNLLQEWLEASPQDVAVRQFLASVYQSSGDVERAISENERVLEQYPNSGVALNNLAWLYFHEKNNEKLALEHAKKAHTLFPDNIAILDTYGWLLLETGSHEQGMWLLQSAAKASTDNSIHYHLAVALARTGERAAAAEKLEAILESSKTFTEKEEAKVLLRELQ